MRKAFFDQFDAFARRAPGWGTRIPSKDADGKPTVITVSKSWFLRQLGASDVEPTPRADKGTGYVYDAPKVRTRAEDGTPLTFSGRTRRLVSA